MQLTISEAHKAFKGVAALDGAALELRPGEQLGLLGPNGAGKTTLVRAVSGRVRLDSGTVSLDGRALGVRDPRPELGIVPQEISVYPLLSTRQNLQVFGRFSGVSKGALRERVEWALGWTGLSDRADEPVKNFSGSMKRRVNIACATLHRPGMLILDEPTVGVDPQSRERIYDMLDELCAEGTSILLTTHQLDEAEVRCDRIIILDHGRTIAEGTLPELVVSTIGPSRQVTIWVDREIEGGLEGFEIGADPRQLSLQVEDVAKELSRAFTTIREAGYLIKDVDVRGPGLQAVFLHLTMGRMLAGKWIFLTAMGIAQVVVMFLWGWAVFDLDLFGHLPGFAVMTLVTASAASGFGLVLATLCRTRSQLSGISTMVILSMSAIGGSMFPRFLMSDTMQSFGLLTFNAWAIDGYTKVFWREAVLVELWPQVGVLVVLSLVFMGTARMLARRWETS